MRKKSKYKPKGVRMDTMTWIMEVCTLAMLDKALEVIQKVISAKKATVIAE